MPSLIWSQAITAGSSFLPLQGWQYEYVPMGGSVRILHRATAVGMKVTITSGSDTLQESSPVPAGGTAGQTPPEFAVPPVDDEVAASDRLKISYTNPTGGTITVDGIILYTPG